jgi:hypothetical protein
VSGAIFAAKNARSSGAKRKMSTRLQATCRGLALAPGDALELRYANYQQRCRTQRNGGAHRFGKIA